MAPKVCWETLYTAVHSRTRCTRKIASDLQKAEDSDHTYRTVQSRITQMQRLHITHPPIQTQQPREGEKQKTSHVVKSKSQRERLQTQRDHKHGDTTAHVTHTLCMCMTERSRNDLQSPNTLKAWNQGNQRDCFYSFYRSKYGWRAASSSLDQYLIEDDVLKSLSWARYIKLFLILSIIVSFKWHLEN